jgi:hypothetical protein
MKTDHVRRTVRSTTVLLAAASVMALTACQAGQEPNDRTDGVDRPASSPSRSADADSPGGDSSSGGEDGSGAAAGSTGSASGGSTPDALEPTDVPPCSTFDVDLTVTLADASKSQFLLMVTNKSKKECNALNYPVVTFGDLDGRALFLADTHPKDIITLKPGESAYAGLMGGRNDGNGKIVQSIGMTMDTKSDLDQKVLTADTPDLYVTEEASVSAWLHEPDDALRLQQEVMDMPSSE